MAVVTQATYVKIANEITTAMGAIGGIIVTVQTAVDNYVNSDAGAALAAMQTIALNADGTFGSVDESPVAGNPINPAPITGTFTEVQSSYNYGAALNLLQEFLALVGGSTVTQQSAAPTLLSLFNP